MLFTKGTGFSKHRRASLKVRVEKNPRREGSAVIREKSAIWGWLDHSELHFTLFRNHVLIPWWIPNEINNGIIYAV